MALYGPLCYEAPVAAHGYVTVVTVLLKAVFPGVELDVRRRAMAVVARPVWSAQGWSRRGSLTRAECSAFVLSTVHSARPWRVRPSDAPAGDAIPPPTLPRSLPGETSTELDAFPYSLTKLQRPPFCTFLVLVAACPGVYDAASYVNPQVQTAKHVTDFRGRQICDSTRALLAGCRRAQFAWGWWNWRALRARR